MLLSRIEFFIAIFLMASVSFPNVALANSANDVEGCKKGSYQLRDLELEFLHIANQDVTQIVQILSSLGYNTVSLDDKASASKRKVESYDCDELPVVMLPPALEEARLEFNADESSSSSSSSKQPTEGMQCAQSFIISFSIYMYKPYRVFHADASNCPGSTAVFVYFVRMKVIIKCYLAHHTNVLVPSTLCGNLKEIYRYLKFDRSLLY